MSTASAHRNKRLQPSITSYFTRADRYDADAALPSARNQPPQGLAPVPANVQASLLNVGMRVRKSVPEGYKTHKTIPPAATPSAPSHLQYEPRAAFTTPSNPPPPPPTATSELLPFCGLHKTGGYTIQPRSTSRQPHDDHPAQSTGAAHPVDAHAPLFPASDFGGRGDAALLLSSQESSTSTVSTDSLPSNKRRYEDDDGEDDDHDDQHAARPLFPTLNTGLAAPVPAEDVQVSPRTMYPGSGSAHFGFAARPVARPRSRRRGGGAGAGDGNGNGRAASRRQAVDEDPLDFGEADFLRPPSSEGGAEVEMGGV